MMDLVTVEYYGRGLQICRPFSKEESSGEDEPSFVFPAYHKEIFHAEPKPEKFSDKDDSTIILILVCGGTNFSLKHGLLEKLNQISVVNEDISKFEIKKTNGDCPFTCAVSLNNVGCEHYENKQYKPAKEKFASALEILDYQVSPESTGLPSKKIQLIRVITRNNYAVVFYNEGYIEKALLEFRKLFQEEIEERQGSAREVQEDFMSKDSSLCCAQNSICEKLTLVVLINNYSCASFSGENHDLIVRDLENALEVCRFWFAKSENHAVKRLVSSTLARILTTQGKLKQALVMFDLHGIDVLSIRKDFDESPLAIFYVKNVCFLLAQRGERERAKECFEEAMKLCKENYDEHHAMVLAASSPLFQPRTRGKTPSLKYSAACQVLSIPELNEHSAAREAGKKDFQSSEKENLMLLSSRDSPLLLFLNSPEQSQKNMRISCRVNPNTKSLLPKISSIKVKTKAEDILSEVQPLLTKKDYLSCSYEDKCHIITGVCVLLEELLATETNVVTKSYQCICLLYNLAHETREDSHEVEMYKDCDGMLSHFISFKKLRMHDGEIPLTIVFLCGNPNHREENFSYSGKPLFRKITYQGLRNDRQEDEDRSSRFGYLVFLRSPVLLDINDLRRVKEIIVGSMKSLEPLSINAGCQGNVFIEVVPGIDPVKLPEQSLHLRLILSCLVDRDELVLSDPIREPNVQTLHLQILQKLIVFNNKSNLDGFVAVFQCTFSNLSTVDVLHKTRNAVIWVLKDHHFSLLSLHTKANTAYLTIQDVCVKCSSEGVVGNGAIQLIDDIIRECFEKLLISSSYDPHNVWKRLSDEQSDERSFIFGEEEDILEKAQKANARLTAELEYLQEKTQKLSIRMKNLLDKLSEMECREVLLQNHFVQTTCSDKDRAIAAEKWFAKKSRHLDPREARSNDGDHELEQLLKSMSSDELAEFLYEYQRPDLVSVSINDKTSDQARESPIDEDIEGAACHLTSADKKKIVEEEKIEIANGKSFDLKFHHDYVEGKDLSCRPSWCFPSPEITQDSPTLNIAVVETPILTEMFTQTDSLSLVHEYKDVIVQTDPAQLGIEETLEKGSADFERDRAERLLRKARLSQDVMVFKNRPRKSTPGSSEDSIFTETSGFSSEGTHLLTSDYLSSQLPSECSIVSEASSEASSHGTEDVSSEGTPRDSITSAKKPSEEPPRASITSESLPEPWPPECSIISEASSHGTEDVFSEVTPRDSITSARKPSEETSRASVTSNSLPKPWSPECSIISEASSHGTEGVPHSGKTSQDSITSVSLPEQQPSQPSIGESSNHGTEDVFRGGTTLQHSISSGFLREQQPSQPSIVRGASNHGTEDVFRGGTALQHSISSVFLPLQQPSIVRGASNHGTEDVFRGGTALQHSISSCFLPIQQPSQPSIVRGASNHGTGNVFGKGIALQYSISSGFLPLQQPSQPSIVRGASNHGTGDVFGKGIALQHSISSGFLPIQQPSQPSIVRGASNHGTEDVFRGGTLQDSITSVSLTEQQPFQPSKKFGDDKPDANERRVPILLTEKVRTGKSPIFIINGDTGAGKSSLSTYEPDEASKRYLDVVDGQLRIEKTKDTLSACVGHSKSTCVDMQPSLPMSCRSSTRFLECVESDGGERPLGHAIDERTTLASYSNIISEPSASFDFLPKVVCDDEISTHDVTPRKCDDVISNNRISSDDVRSRSDGADIKLDIGSNTKIHSKAESKTFHGKLQDSESSRKGSIQCLFIEQRSVTGTTNNEEAASHSKDVGKMVSSFRNGAYMSLPTKVLHLVSNAEKDEAALTDIIETDDSDEMDEDWNSQGARPKRTSLIDDYIAPGVDNSFLARHSIDPSLTRSVFSLSRLTTNHIPFSSLPVCSNKRVEVLPAAKTWPFCNDDSEQLLQAQNHLSPFVESRLPYQGLPRDTGKEPVRAFGMEDVDPGKGQTKERYSGTVRGYGVRLPGRPHSVAPCTTCEAPLPRSHLVAPCTTGEVLLPGNHSVVFSGSSGSINNKPVKKFNNSYNTTRQFTFSLKVKDDDVSPLKKDLNAIAVGNSQMGEESKVAFHNIHELRFPSDGLLTSPTENTNSSSDDDLYKTADNSLESLESLEDQINRSRMTWSQMSASAMFRHDEHEQDESLHEDMPRTEYQEETDRRTAASGEGNVMNENSSEREVECKSGTNGKSVENPGRIKRWLSWAKKLRRTEVEGRETDLEKGDAEQLTSLSAQCVSADACDARERELRIARAQEREQKRKKEFADIERRLEASQREKKQNAPTSPQPARLPVNAEQLTSLSAQRISADACDARERELRIARTQEREQKRKKEFADIERRLEASQREKKQNAPISPQPARLPVQESELEWPCSHYKRKCSIKFPCCEEFYSCHRCHNDSDKCVKDNMKALHGTHLRCLVCNTEQEITENSHCCVNCKTELAEYFCGICKHFTGQEKTPYHCTPCGICRIHSDRSFHCDVCNVCLDVRLLNNHKCRPDSGHDQCCICLEDAFGGCQILPCSHKVHRECAVAMLKNGVRKCPVCRHPLNLPLQH